MSATPNGEDDRDVLGQDSAATNEEVPLRAWWMDDDDDEGGSRRDAHERTAAYGATNFLLVVQRFSRRLRSFSDPDVELAYLNYSQLPNLFLHFVGSISIAVVISVVFTFITPNWPRRSERLEIIVPNLFGSAVFLLLGCFFFVCWRRRLLEGGFYSERFVVLVHFLWITILCFSVSTQARYVPVDAGSSYRTFKTPTEALTYYVDNRAFSLFPTICVFRPRFLPYVVALMAYPFALIPVIRWAFIPDAPFFYWIPIFIVLTLSLTFLFAADEIASRGRFKENAKLEDGIRRAEVSKQEVNSLVLAMISEAVLHRLVTGGVVADSQDATVVFSDVVGFTSWSSHTTPLRVVRMLCDMYRRFDARLDEHHVEKVTTVGDAYWAACGIPTPNTHHARNATLFALDMVKCVPNLKKRFGISGIRVGVATGLVQGGVIGREEVSYQLFGEVNEHAERLEQLAPLNGVLGSDMTAACVGAENDVVRFVRATSGAAAAVNAFVAFSWNDADGEMAAGGLLPISPMTAPPSSRASFTHRTSARTSNSAGAQHNDAAAMVERRSVLRVGQQVAIDFMELREQLGVTSMFGTFVDPVVHSAFTSMRKDEFVTKATACAICWFVWDVTSLCYAASSLTGTGHASSSWATATAATAAGLAICAAVLSLMAHRAPCVVHAVHFFLQVNAYFWILVYGPDDFVYCGDARYMMSFMSFMHAAIGFPYGVPELGLTVVALLGGVLPGNIAVYARHRTVFTTIALSQFLTVATTSLLSSVALARMQRSQCVGRFIATAAAATVDAEVRTITSLLGRAMPSFVLPELTNWLTNGRKGLIAHQFANVAVMFLRATPRQQKAPAMHACVPGSDCVTEVRGVLEGLTAAADAIASLVEHDALVYRVKVLGDVHLLAAGLDATQHVALNHATVSLVQIAWKLQADTQDDTPDEGSRHAVAMVAGIHCGPAAGGVLGDERLIYDVFGDTVNTAARVMTTSTSTGVYLSTPAYEATFPTCSAPASASSGQLEDPRVGQSVDKRAYATTSLDMHATVVVAVALPGEVRHAKGKGTVEVFKVAHVLLTLQDDDVRKVDA